MDGNLGSDVINSVPFRMRSLILDTDHRPMTDNIPQFVHDSVAKIAVEQGFTVGEFRVTFEPGCSKGDGFVSDFLRAVIEQLDSKKRLVVLCKMPPQSKFRRNQFCSILFFERESLVYNKLLPKMTQFQREMGVVRKDQGFFGVPRCFLADLDKEKEKSVIVMEDLRERGMKMWNKLVPMNYEHSRIVMAQLGRFHAVSFALKHQQPEYFEQSILPDFRAGLTVNTEFTRALLKSSMDRTVDVLEDHEETARQKMLALKDNYFNVMSKCCDSSSAEPYTVLVHSDCWINNLMFSYKNNIPDSVALLDWQTTRYASPVLDLSFFLFCCTDEAFRRQYYDEMLHIYHDSLTTLLQKLGGNASEQFPFTALLEQLELYACYGLFKAGFVLPVICTPNEDVPDQNEMFEKFEEAQKIEGSLFAVQGTAEQNYRERMAGVIRDMIRFGYI